MNAKFVVPRAEEFPPMPRDRPSARSPTRLGAPRSPRTGLVGDLWIGTTLSASSAFDLGWRKPKSALIPARRDRRMATKKWGLLSRGLVRHPHGVAGERAFRLQDDHKDDDAVLALSLDQHSLTAARMEPIVDPPFKQMFVGSMSPCRAEAGPREDFRRADRSGRPSSGVASACRTARDSGPSEPVHWSMRRAQCRVVRGSFFPTRRGDRYSPDPRFALPDPLRDFLARLLGYFELNGTTRLLLHDHGPRPDAPTQRRRRPATRQGRNREACCRLPS
jgi:hypothetical protein